MPVKFLADEEAAVFGCYAGPPTRAELDRMFYLDDEDLRLIAKRRGDRGFTATAVDWQGTRSGTAAATPSQRPCCAPTAGRPALATPTRAHRTHGRRPAAPIAMNPF